MGNNFVINNNNLHFVSVYDNNYYHYSISMDQFEFVNNMNGDINIMDITYNHTSNVVNIH